MIYCTVLCQTRRFRLEQARVGLRMPLLSPLRASSTMIHIIVIYLFIIIVILTCICMYLFEMCKVLPVRCLSLATVADEGYIMMPCGVHFVVFPKENHAHERARNRERERGIEREREK